jgi:hypothetical protein
MSSYLNAITTNEYFYILPVCNLFINPFTLDPENIDDPTWIEFTSTGYSTLTTTGGNQGQYNDNLNEIILTDKIKNLDIDYISFSSNYSSTVPTTAGQDVNVITCDLVYTIENGLNPFIDGNGTSVNLIEQDKYYVQLKAHSGKLIPIDFRNLYSIRDIVFLFTDELPAPTVSADKNNKARPYNITLWKKFLTSSNLNKNSFIVSGLLPSGINEYVNPNY